MRVTKMLSTRSLTCVRVVVPSGVTGRCSIVLMVSAIVVMTAAGTPVIVLVGVVTTATVAVAGPAVTLGIRSVAGNFTRHDGT